MNRTLNPLSPGVLVKTTAAVISLAPPLARFSLRARGDISLLEVALGMSLPDRIGQREAKGDVEAFRLGPDEWVLLAGQEDTAKLTQASERVYPALPHSLVDISAREMTFVIEGEKAAGLLSIGCPHDIASIPPGEARRTVFDAVSVTLWCNTPTRYRLDCWNSFAPHIYQLLEIGAREIAAQI